MWGHEHQCNGKCKPNLCKKYKKVRLAIVFVKMTMEVMLQGH
jgi:hypothetical protein